MEPGLSPHCGPTNSSQDSHWNGKTEQITRNSRSRGWCLTWNNYPETWRDSFDALPVEYLIIGQETAPTTGTRHLQGYIYFRNARTLSSLRRKFPGVHFVGARGTAAQNKDYCSKGGDVFERGILPASDESRGDAERTRWDNALALARIGELESIPSDIFLR